MPLVCEAGIGAKGSLNGEMSAFPYRQTWFFSTAVENVPTPRGQALRSCGAPGSRCTADDEIVDAECLFVSPKV